MQRQLPRIALLALLVVTACGCIRETTNGDTHIYRVDNPLGGITRLETYGSPFVGWVKVDVDSTRPNPFTFEPRLESVVLPR